MTIRGYYDRQKGTVYCIRGQSTECMDEHFQNMSFAEKNSSVDTRDEVFATLNIKLDSKPGNHTLKLKVDTSAQDNTLPLRIYRRMHPKCLKADGYPRPGGIVKHQDTILTAYNSTRTLVDTGGPGIFGLPSLRQLDFVTLHCAVQADEKSIQRNENNGVHIDELLKQYPNQFDCIGNFHGEYHIVTDPQVQLVIHAPRKCPIQLKDDIKNCLDEIVEKGVIRKIDEPTDWVTSLAYSRKQHGKLCLEPKDLNKAIKNCHHHTPTLEEITHQFAGSQHFSKLDAKNEYWSVNLDAESQQLTTFNSPFGRFCFQRMPFGLVMSQDVFHQRMDEILDKCTGTLGIADYIAVYRETKTEHDKYLHNLMKVARDNGLVLNSEKCAIGQERIHFFGMVYDAKGVHPDSERVEDIRNTPAPTNKTCLQQFLGMATYMSPFVPQLAELIAPPRL